MQGTPATQATTQVPTSPLWLSEWKDGSAAVASTLTAGALIVGGYVGWRYYRNRFPRAKVTHSVLDWLAGDRRIVRGVVRVENVGQVIVQIRCIRGVLTQVVPVPADVLSALKERRDPVERDSTEVVWDTLGDRQKDFSKDGCEIEPGEADEFIFDFVIDADVAKVQFYSHLENVKKYKRNVGWNTTVIYDVGMPKQGKPSSHKGQGEPKPVKAPAPPPKKAEL
jgi:hypothetical protein